MYCKNCGTVVPEDVVFCPNCGEKVDDTGSVVSDEKRGNGSQSLETTEGLDNHKQEMSFIDLSSVGNVSSTTIKINKKIKTSEKKASTSSTELWSWLKKGSKRTQYYTESMTSIDTSEFMNLVCEKIESNNVPAKIKSRNINWDLGKTSRDIYYVEPETDTENILTCLVQFEKVGNFVYIDEKTFITPPELPVVPGKYKEINPTLRENKMLLGIGLAICGVFALSMAPLGLALLVIGGFFIIDAYKKNSLLSELESHNRNVEIQESRWNNAWNQWEKSIFNYAFQEDINGKVGRIYDSVSSCIKQVCDEKFKIQKSKEKEESSSMNELEQMILRRKEEYK